MKFKCWNNSGEECEIKEAVILMCNGEDGIHEYIDKCYDTCGNDVYQSMEGVQDYKPTKSGIIWYLYGTDRFYQVSDEFISIVCNEMSKEHRHGV